MEKLLHAKSMCTGGQVGFSALSGHRRIWGRILDFPWMLLGELSWSIGSYSKYQQMHCLDRARVLSLGLSTACSGRTGGGFLFYRLSLFSKVGYLRELEINFM